MTWPCPAWMRNISRRRHSRSWRCRAFGVLPIMVGHADKAATYASAEQMFQAHVTHTLLPRMVRIEQSADAHLLGRRQVEQGYQEFTAAALVRGTLDAPPTTTARRWAPVALRPGSPRTKCASWKNSTPWAGMPPGWRLGPMWRRPPRPDWRR